MPAHELSCPLLKNLSRNLPLTTQFLTKLHTGCLCLTRDPDNRLFDLSQLTSSLSTLPTPVYFFAYWDQSSWLCSTFQVYLILAMVAQQMGPEPFLLTKTPMWGAQICHLNSSEGVQKGGRPATLFSVHNSLSCESLSGETSDATSLFPKIFWAFPLAQPTIEIIKSLGRVWVCEITSYRSQRL